MYSRVLLLVEVFEILRCTSGTEKMSNIYT